MAQGYCSGNLIYVLTSRAARAGKCFLQVGLGYSKSSHPDINVPFSHNAETVSKIPASSRAIRGTRRSSDDLSFLR